VSHSVVRLGYEILTSELVDLHSTQHGNIDSSRPYHTKALMAAEDRRTAVQSDSLLASVDEIRVLLTGLGVPAHTQDTILRLEDDLSALG